jgi:hypothetical protein
LTLDRQIPRNRGHVLEIYAEGGIEQDLPSFYGNGIIEPGSCGIGIKLLLDGELNLYPAVRRRNGDRFRGGEARCGKEQCCENQCDR